MTSALNYKNVEQAMYNCGFISHCFGDTATCRSKVAEFAVYSRRFDAIARSVISYGSLCLSII